MPRLFFLCFLLFCFGPFCPAPLHCSVPWRLPCDSAFSEASLRHAPASTSSLWHIREQGCHLTDPLPLSPEQVQAIHHLGQQARHPCQFRHDESSCFLRVREGPVSAFRIFVMGALGATNRSSKETNTQTIPRQVLRGQENMFAVSTEA